MKMFSGLVLIDSDVVSLIMQYAVFVIRVCMCVRISLHIYI